MALTDAERLRAMLNDTDPDDPILSAEQIADLLTAADNNLERAAYDGWRIKSAYYADLVDVTEGNASRAMSDLQDHAILMMKTYERSRSGPTEGRTRIGRIVRSR